MLISPWVAKGTVFQEPQAGPSPTSQFELTSVPATIKNLFNLSSFLTKRDAWAGNFEELLLDARATTRRCICPTRRRPPHRGTRRRPPAGRPTTMATTTTPPPSAGSFGRRMATTTTTTTRRRRALAVGAGGDVAEPAPERHCSSWHGGPEAPCRAATAPSLKQQRNARLLAALTGRGEAEVEGMDSEAADRFIAKAWNEWMTAQ